MVLLECLFHMPVDIKLSYLKIHLHNTCIWIIFDNTNIWFQTPKESLIHAFSTKCLSVIDKIMFVEMTLVKPCETLFGKVVLSVGAALCKSFFCPRLVLGLSSFVLFVVLTMSLYYPSYVPGLSSSLNIFLMLSLPIPFSSRRLQQRLTKEIRKAIHIPKHVLFVDS